MHAKLQAANDALQTIFKDWQKWGAEATSNPFRSHLILRDPPQLQLYAYCPLSRMCGELKEAVSGTPTEESYEFFSHDERV